MDPFMSNQDEFSAPAETVKTPDGTRSSRKLKRSKAKLVTLGVAATVAAGASTAIGIGSASAGVRHSPYRPAEPPGVMRARILAEGRANFEVRDLP